MYNICVWACALMQNPKGVVFMGLIKAIKAAGGSALGDQWKEFFYCEAMPKEVMVTKGVKRVGANSSNTNGSDNIISNGSGIAVADGQCMIIVEQGKVVEVCAEAGEYTYDTSTEPSVFAGGLGKGILDTFKTVGKRFTYGGDTGKGQRVYYFNTKELIDNKFGTPNPVMFRVVDSKIGLDIDVSLRCSGVYSYKIADPLLFYTNVCGNVQKAYLRTEIEEQLKAEFIAALQPALAQLSNSEIRPNQIPAHTMELGDAMNGVLSAKWGETRGLKIVSVAVANLSLPEEDAERIKNLQASAVLRDPNMAAATLVGAQAEAMKTAAGNSAGAMTGFMGMGMAMNANGGVNAANLYAMGAQQQAAAPAADGWACACGKTGNTGKFCADCGAKKPEDGWTCACGAVNKGKFCAECGAKKPDGAPLYKCDKCGWEPEDPKNPPKFCPECGDVFDENDAR